MDRIYKQFKEAKKNPLMKGVGFVIFLIISYVAYLDSSYVLIGINVIILIYIGYEIYLDLSFNRYLNTQKALVQDNPELVMKNLIELYPEEEENNKSFEGENIPLGKKTKNEILEMKKRKKTKEKKEVYDIIFIIKDHIKRKKNNI